MKHYLTLISLLFATVACSGSESDTDTTAQGIARYPAASDSEESTPPRQSMTVEIVVEGTGTISGLEPQCSLDGVSGSFVGLLDGTADVSGDGAYVAALASADAQLTTPAGCEIPQLEVAAISRVSIRGELGITTRNCDTYCEAKASSEAAAMCGAGPSNASCRAEAAGEYAASCTTSCSAPQTHAIVAQTELSATQIAQLNAANLAGMALGELSADLTFTRMENAEGDTVNEAP